MILIVSPQSSQSVSEGRLNFPGCQAVILAQEVLSRDYIAKTIIWINWLLAASSCFLIITVVRGERERRLPAPVSPGFSSFIIGVVDLGMKSLLSSPLLADWLTQPCEMLPIIGQLSYSQIMPGPFRPSLHHIVVVIVTFVRQERLVVRTAEGRRYAEHRSNQSWYFIFPPGVISEPCLTSPLSPDRKYSQVEENESIYLGGQIKILKYHHHQQHHTTKQYTTSSPLLPPPPLPL